MVPVDPERPPIHDVLRGGRHDDHPGGANSGLVGMTLAWLERHRTTCIYGFLVALFAATITFAINDRVRVEKRLDRQDGHLLENDRQLRDLIAANERAIDRLERLEHPTRLDLQRLFRGLLEAASPREVRRLVRRLRELGFVVPTEKQLRRRRGGEAPGGGNPPPGPPGPSP